MSEMDAIKFLHQKEIENIELTQLGHDKLTEGQKEKLFLWHAQRMSILLKRAERIAGVQLPEEPEL